MSKGDPIKKKQQKRRHSRQSREWLSGIKKTKGCEICGYNRCVDALHFHHIDPGAKRGALSGKSMLLASFVRLHNEVQKCLIVCANCHTEIHCGMHPEYLVINESDIAEAEKEMQLSFL